MKMKLKTKAAKARQKRIAFLIKEGRLGALCAFAAGATMVGGCSEKEMEAEANEVEEIEEIEVDIPEPVTNKGMEMSPIRTMGRAPLARTNRTNEAVASFRSVGLRPPTEDEAKALTNLVNEARRVRTMGFKTGKKNGEKE